MTEKDRIRIRKWVKNNPERKKEIARKSYYKNRDKFLLSGARYRAANPDRIRIKYKEYNNREEVKSRRRKRYLNNREQILRDCKLRYEKNKDAKKLYDRQYRLKNREKINLTKKRYNENHKQDRRIWIKDYNKKRRQVDIEFRLKAVLRTRLNNALKVKKVRKTNNILKLIGCSIFELRKHLELQFKRGMSWENYGLRGWHIDHIKPCASFNLTDLEQQKQCFHYTNLQPLWRQDNLVKGAKAN